MGKLVDGQWITDEIAAAAPDGRWTRAETLYRNWLTADGSPGPDGQPGFRAEPDRYHLYVAWNCPWAHRTLLARAFKRLEALLPISICAPRRTDQGWVFADDPAFADKLYGSHSLHEVYTRGDPSASGRVTVPVLWDLDTERIVSNESADIVRMLDTAFVDCAPQAPRLYPADLAGDIDRWNALIHPKLNNGVYRAGFATSQAAYDEAVTDVFETLDTIEAQLARTAYLTGDRVTEADLRLFPTLARFDVAYFGAFKCNIRRLIDYPNLWRFARAIYALPGVADTVKLDLYKRGYFSPSPKRNPHGIVPGGPAVDFAA